MPSDDWSLADWLNWQEGLHPQSIDLGLGRLGQVYRRLPQLQRAVAGAQIITIAGTNGKGTCARACEALALAAGRQVGTYSSPHLWRYAERIRVNGAEAADDRIVDAFRQIEAVRGDVSLSYFEYGTLAAWLVFAAAGLDVWVLEVGLGGRLDAVNLLDADVSVVTSIGLDHADWLGDDLEGIASEKLAVGREGRPLLLGPGLPQSAAAMARARGCLVEEIGVDLKYAVVDGHLQIPRVAALDGMRLPPGLVESNLVLAQQATEALGIAPADACTPLQQLRLPGRCMRHFDGELELVFDVGHNTQAIEHLVRWLRAQTVRTPCVAIFAALADKPIEAMSAALDELVDEWLLVPLDNHRALSPSQLRQRMAVSKPVSLMEDMDAALAYVRGHARRAVVCGSFFTVAAAGEQNFD